MPKLTVVETPIPTAIATLANDFLSDSRARGLSVRSVDHYRNSLFWHFLPWAASEGITDPAQLTPQLAGRFTTRLLDEGGRRGQPLARASVRTYVQATRVFLKWCESPDGGAVAVGGSPKLPKRTKPLVDVLSRDELQRMENAARTERDKLIVRVLADCGIRLQELLAIQPEDVREARKGEYGILVHGKGGKDRIAPLQPVLYRRLRQFISGGGLDTGERIFLSIRRDALGRFTPLTDTGVEQVVKLLARAAGITKRVYPHLIRHSYATNFLRKGGNVIALQRILGHANLDQIQATYVHLDTSDDWQANMAVLAKD